MSYIEPRKKRKYPGLKEAERQRSVRTADQNETCQEDPAEMSYDEYERWLILNNID